MSLAAMLVLAMLLDAALGEPRWLWDRLPHPVVLMGRAVSEMDNRLNCGDARKARGVATMMILGCGALILGWILAQFGSLISIVIAAILISQQSLVQHVAAVGEALRLSLGDGRVAVAKIVGRDTATMNEPAVARAAIESAAENLSDGVIAPAFWFLIGGLPGILLYKITNTADSMIGHRNDKYRAFGWAAARFDDLLNWAPARLTALLMALVHGQFNAWKAITTDAQKHRSPNAGWPEAAMARVLDVSLAGPRSYDGEMRDFPFVHPEGHKHISPVEIDKSCRALWATWGAGLASTALLWVLFA